METVEYQRWSPADGSAGIEFSRVLVERLQETQRAAKPTHGLLTGFQHGSEVRVLEAIRAGASDAGSLKPVGVFSCRRYGEVFLTETDLARMEQAGVHCALVVAGDRAGFFLRRADGSIQAVRSEEEFSIHGMAREKEVPPAAAVSESSPPAPPAPTSPVQQQAGAARSREYAAKRGPNSAQGQAAVPGHAQIRADVRGETSRVAKWLTQTAVRVRIKRTRSLHGISLHWISRMLRRLYRELQTVLQAPRRDPWLPPANHWPRIAMAIGVLAVPIAGIAYLQPRMARSPIPMQVDEIAGQLVVRWEPQREPMQLEIVDHGEQVEIPLEAGTTGVTYGYSGNDVQLRLASLGRTGELIWNGARFVTPKVPVVETRTVGPDDVRRVEELKREVRRLRESVRKNDATIAELEERVRGILERKEGPR